VMSAQQYTRWDKITAADYQAFVGFSILMGITHKPAIHHYWSKDPVYRYAPVADRITRDRFREISRYLHYADNTKLPKPGEANYNRLGKVQPVIDYLHHQFTTRARILQWMRR
jgi:hypothetical protein